MNENQDKEANGGIAARKWPSWRQWRQLPKLLDTKERFQILAGLFLIIAALLSWFMADRIYNYRTAPDFGGDYSEAIVGQPQYLNPLLENLNLNNVDQDIDTLVYSGLIRINEKGDPETDLASRYEVSDDGKVYTVWLKDNIFWQDKKPITADDVIFTVNTLKNPDAKSPLRLNWQGVEVEKLDDKAVRFKLENASYSFLQNLTMGILPAHIWSNVSVRNLGLAEPNLSPVGSGPYRFEKLQKDGTGFIRSISLVANDKFYRQRPYLNRIVLKFYQTEQEAIAAWNNGDVEGLNKVSAGNFQFVEAKDKAQVFNITLHRFFAVFFNQTQSSVIADKNVRLALTYATNKKDIVKQVTHSLAETVSSPFPQVTDAVTYQFDIAKADEILNDAQWLYPSTDSAVLEKKIVANQNAKTLTIKVTVPDVPELRQTAELMKTQWAAVGADLEPGYVDVNSIQNQNIRPRNYEALLFGLAQGAEPDPYVFWHSSQKRDPGFNLALYDNNNVDGLLDDLRRTQDPAAQKDILSKIDGFIQADAPAIFLYNPYYIYLIRDDVMGASIGNITFANQRFAGIEQWYKATKRVRK